jgi:hypothetical protein
MKVAVQDAAALHALKPLEVAAYLRAKGWRKEVDLDNKASLWLWRDPEGEEFDVMLPLKRELGDFVLRMGELLRTLANAEQRSQLEVIQDFLTTTADLIRVRASSRDVDNGTLPLEQAVAFVEHSRDLMLAAACAALDKRPYYATRKATQAMDYLSRVRMGQTERGSYVLTMLSPIAPELKPAQGELPLSTEAVEPYERRVTRTLVEALTALDEAARQAAIQGDMGPFQAAVQRGVSANLCDAVVGLSIASPAEGLDIQVSWSRSRPVEGKAPARVRFGSDSIPIIEEAGRRFRDTASLEDFEVEGFVTRLDRGPKATDGDVTITGIVDGQMRKIVVRLGTDTYSEAVRAHKDRRTVKCTGDLVKEGRAYRLQDPRHFQVMALDDAA